MRIDEQSTKADAQRCWDAPSAEPLREEFGTFARYESWRLAAARGSVKLFGSKVTADGSLTPRSAVVS